jgi:hypothetical protein
MFAEYHVWKGYNSVDLNTRIEHFKLASKVYPFKYHFRIIAASELGRLAVNNNSMMFGKLALPVLNDALKVDVSPELLGPAVVINYGVGNVEQAKTYYSLFKQTAKRSNYLDFLKGALQ